MTDITLCKHTTHKPHVHIYSLRNDVYRATSTLYNINGLIVFAPRKADIKYTNKNESCLITITNDDT